MAVVESSSGGGGVDLGVKGGSVAGLSFESSFADATPDTNASNEEAGRQTEPQQRTRAMTPMEDSTVPNGVPVLRPQFDPADFHPEVQQLQGRGQATTAEQGEPGGGVCTATGARRSNGGGGRTDGEHEGNGLRRDIKDLEELLSKLNPMAEEFVPSSVINPCGSYGGENGDEGGDCNNFATQTHVSGNGNGSASGNRGGRKKTSYSQGKRRNTRTSLAQREDIIRRTVYVSDIDQQVTEEQLAALFVSCGQVVDCRVCGDPNSVLRFAFIEFTDEEGARAALNLSGTMLGYYPVKVLPSKTAIVPVNPTFLPRSDVEREMCARTIYCTNIDKRVSQADVKLFFESICGEVQRLRLLGDYHHSTRIAFVEFVVAESAIAALNCSGVVLGSLPIRVSPSKTPVRARAPRPSMQ